MKSAIYHFKKIISDFPNSKYRNKSLVVLNIEEPNAVWSELLEKENVDNKSTEKRNIFFIIGFL